jgi:hypothetical protein
MSCGCGCGGSGAGIYNGSPPAWRSTGPEDGAGAGCAGRNGVGQPGRHPGGGRGRGLPWWIWIVVALVGYRLLKGSA